MTLAEAKREWPLGSIIKDKYKSEKYIVGYRMIDENVIGFAVAYVKDFNGNHNLIEHFNGGSFVNVLVEEGIKRAGIPLSRHGGWASIEDSTMVEKNNYYNWIKL